MLRYQEDNELHLDFHGTTNTTLNYIADHYGVETLKEILRKTGRDVYKSIHEKLQQGDASELLEHLNWFFHHEKGKFQLTVDENKITFEVFECPAVRHLRKLGLEPSPHLCLQTSEVNAGMCEDSPWSSEVQVISEGHCIQTFVREDNKK